MINIIKYIYIDLVKCNCPFLNIKTKWAFPNVIFSPLPALMRIVNEHMIGREKKEKTCPKMQYLKEQLIWQATVYQCWINIWFSTSTSHRCDGSDINSIKIWNRNPENNKKSWKSISQVYLKIHRQTNRRLRKHCYLF